jgi:hypothetical protein
VSAPTDLSNNILVYSKSEEEHEKKPENDAASVERTPVVCQTEQMLILLKANTLLGTYYIRRRDHCGF